MQLFFYPLYSFTSNFFNPKASHMFTFLFTTLPKENCILFIITAMRETGLAIVKIR